MGTLFYNSNRVCEVPGSGTTNSSVYHFKNSLKKNRTENRVVLSSGTASTDLSINYGKLLVRKSVRSNC